MVSGVDWHTLRQNTADFFWGAAFGRHQHEIRRQALELNDLFMLHCYLEQVGLPNPVALHLLEIYPYFLDEFHLWHRRMGFKHSPLGELPCC